MLRHAGAPTHAQAYAGAYARTHLHAHAYTRAGFLVVKTG